MYPIHPRIPRLWGPCQYVGLRDRLKARGVSFPLYHQTPLSVKPPSRHYLQYSSWMTANKRYCSPHDRSHSSNNLQATQG